MNNQESRKLTTFAAALLAIFAFPAFMCAQTAPTTTTPAKKPAAVPVKPAVVQPKVVVPVKQPVAPPKAAATPVQPAVTPATPPSSVTTTVQPVPTTPVATTNKQPVSTIAQPAVARAATPATTTHPASIPAAGAGTLTWGTVVYSPAGCVHNGTKAVCTLTLANQGNAVTLQAAYQMYTMQFVDDAHVPHAADTAYFVDNYGTRQAQLFVNNGEGGTLIREFPNVNDQVASGEFHLANQVVGGVSVGAPGTIPAQGTAVASPVAAPQPAIQPPVANTATSDPTTQVQQSINQVNDKKQKAKSIWNQLKTIKK